LYVKSNYKHLKGVLNVGSDNLIPFSERTEEEARELGRKGGIKSGESRRRKRTMIEMVKLIGETHADCESKDNLKGILGDRVKDDEMTYSMLVAMTLYQKALKEKDMKAIEKIFEIDGILEEVKNDYNDLSVDELRGLLNGNKP
jgi:phage terminase large subunit